MQSLNNKKCLVLGATGIIGNHVLRELVVQNAREVLACGRGVTPTKNLTDLDVPLIRADTNDQDSLKHAFRGVDVVFHSAGYYPQHYFDKPGHSRAALTQIRNVLSAARECGVARVVYTSSVTTIGRAKLGEMADETLNYDLLGKDPHPYFYLKHKVEEEVRAWAERGDIDVVMVNPTGCFGPFELKPPSLCIVPQIASGRLPGVVDGLINAVDVADVARGHVQAALKGKNGERYILSGHNMTVLKLVEEICAVAGVRPPRFKIPIQPALGVSFLDELLCRFLGRVPHMPLLGLCFVQYGQHYSCQKAQHELAYTFSPLRACLERSLEWFYKIGYCRRR